MGEALEGVRVIEVGRSDAARYLGMLFADFGATVVQLPDPQAHWQPHGAGYDYFGRMLDRGKLTPEPGAPAAFEAWLAGADVLIDGGAHGGVAAAGLPHAALRERYADLVVAAVSLAGRSGPSAGLDGCELIAAARASDLHMTGWPHRPPTRSISPKAEIYAAMWAFAGAVAALRRPRGARGTVVDVACADALLSGLDGSVEHFFESGRTARRKTGEGLLYQVLDGYVVLYPGVTDYLWARFCKLVGRPELVDHPLMKDSSLRRRYPELVEEVVVDWISGKTRAQVVAECAEGGVVVAPVQTLDEIVADPQVEAMGFVAEGGDGGQSWRAGGYPIALTRTPLQPKPHGGRMPLWDARPAGASAPGAAAPLDGLLVLDLGRGIASPYCSMVLADLGASVIRVEDPAAARKEFRNFSGSRRRDGVTETVLVGSYRERNKRSLLIDLTRPEAVPVLDDLIRSADVLLSNLAPGVLARLGYTEERLRELNPRLVYTSNSGFGHRGPLASARAVDPIAVAYSGLMSLGGFEGDPPTKPGQAQIDYLAGLAMAVGSLAALYEREQSGQGQTVHTSLLGMAVTTFGGILEQRLAEGSTPRRSGNQSYRFGARCATWATKDGSQVAIDVTAPEAARRFDQVVPPADAADPSADLAGRLERFAAGRRGHDAARTLVEAGVPAAVVADTREATGLADFWVRGMFLHAEHPRFGTVVITGSPLVVDGRGLELRHLGPQPGEHSREVLQRHTQRSDAEIAALFAAGVVAEPSPAAEDDPATL